MNKYHLLLLCLTFAVSSAIPLVTKPPYQRTVSYEGEILVRCPINVPSVKSFLDNDYIDIWKISPDGLADIRVSHSLLESYGTVKEVCTKLGDIETIVQKSENDTFTGTKADWFEEYHRYDDIINWYKKLAKDNAKIAKYVESIGKSIEGRDQPAIHIGTGTMTIYFQCQIHAREWISGASCMYIANFLVDNPYNEERVKELLNNVTFVFIPFVNPDGYEYSWTTDRLWAKSRRSGATCNGVDLNRNYNVHWNLNNVNSSNECSPSYHGASAESEPETKNTANYFRRLNNIIGAIDFQSYGELILRPYAWTKENCTDDTRLDNMANDMAKDIFETHGMYYTWEKAIDSYGTPTGGTASDWFYSDDANKNNQYRAASYTVVLRDYGTSGYLLPPVYIITQGEEIVQAVLRFAIELNTNPLKK